MIHLFYVSVCKFARRLFFFPLFYIFVFVGHSNLLPRRPCEIWPTSVQFSTTMQFKRPCEISGEIVCHSKTYIFFAALQARTKYIEHILNVYFAILLNDYLESILKLRFNCNFSLIFDRKNLLKIFKFSFISRKYKSKLLFAIRWVRDSTISTVTIIIMIKATCRPSSSITI